MGVQGKRVLIVGDSLGVGYFGSSLAARLREMGARVSTLAHVGAKAADYLDGRFAPEFRSMARMGADVLVLAIGTDDAVARELDPKQFVTSVQSIAAAVGAPDVLWVGPPEFSLDSDVRRRVDALWGQTSGTPGITSFDARDVTRDDPAGHDLTLSMGAAMKLAQEVSGWVERSTVSSLATRVTPEPKKGLSLGVLVTVVLVMLFQFGKRVTGKLKKR